MLSLKLLWLAKNDPKGKGVQYLARTLAVNRTTLDRLIQRKSTQVNIELVFEIDLEIEARRKAEVIIDASFLLPKDIEFCWRFASFDLVNGWRMYNSSNPPRIDVETRKWAMTYEMNLTEATVRELRGLARRIPYDIDVYETENNALYQRCMVSGLWYKVGRAPRICPESDQFPMGDKQKFFETASKRYL